LKKEFEAFHRFVNTMKGLASEKRLASGLMGWIAVTKKEGDLS